MARSYPIPSNETARLERLYFYKVLDTQSEEAFDRITRIATHIMGTPIAVISLIDRDRQWFKSKQGLDVRETTRDIAFCTHAIMKPEAFIVPDATKDTRFADNPLVVQDPSIRFYAGIPLTTDDGLSLGTLCAIDRVPREPSSAQLIALSDLAKIVMDELELRRAGLFVLDEVAHRKKLDDLKSAFIADINHELRTPLTSIIGSLGLLESGVLGEFDPSVTELLRIADRNSKNLLELINDLLDMSKLEAGAMEFEFAAADMVKLMHEVAENVRTYAVEKHVTITIEPQEQIITATVDKRRMAQVLTNLLSNAIKFSPKNGAVFLRAKTSPTVTRVEVTDQGPGIAKAEQGKVFDKFVQAKSSKTTAKGTGLGLSIARSIVESHAGKIGLESEEGQGTTFYFELPTNVALVSGRL